MKRSFTVGLAIVAGAALGAAAVEGLHAQAKPPVYQIVEIDVLNQDAYVNDYAPKAQAAIKAAGGKFLAAGGKTTAIEGDPPKNRVVIQQWDSVEKIAAYRASAAFKDLLACDPYVVVDRLSGLLGQFKPDRLASLFCRTVSRSIA